MIFLIQYNRDEGRIVSFKKFLDSERELAANQRLEMELNLHRRGIHDEVVVLEAPNEEALRRTHQRYFENFAEIKLDLG